MRVDIKWDIFRSDTLVCEFSGDWTWHDCREAMQVMMYMQDGSGAQVNHIYDLTNSTLSTHACVKRIQKLLNLGMQPAPNNIVIVDKPFRLHTIRDTLLILVESWGNVHFTESIEDARTALNNPELQP